MTRLRAFWALVVAGAALAVAAPAGGANECDGLMVCIPVAGPWVVVPTSTGAQRERVEFQLTCPRGYIVGGTDARLSSRAIDVGFIGTIGQPGQPRDHDVSLGGLPRDVRRPLGARCDASSRSSAACRRRAAARACRRRSRRSGRAGP